MGSVRFYWKRSASLGCCSLRMSGYLRVRAPKPCPNALPLLHPVIAVPLSIPCGPMWLDAVSRCVDTLMQAFALLLVI